MEVVLFKPDEEVEKAVREFATDKNERSSKNYRKT